MTDELKPVKCGCGGEAKVFSYDALSGEQLYYVNCTKCGICTPSKLTKAEAITAWNRAMSAEKMQTTNMTILRRKIDLLSILQAIKSDKIRVWLNYDGKICFQNTKTGNEISVEPYYDMEGNTNNE